MMEVAVAGCGREKEGQGDRSELSGRTDTQKDRLQNSEMTDNSVGKQARAYTNKRTRVNKHVT